MEDSRQSRRRLLQAAGILVGGGTALSFTKSASAFQIEEVDPGSSVGLAYSNRCGGGGKHAALMAKLRTNLMKDPSAQSMSAVCPICGCPVMVSR